MLDQRPGYRCSHKQPLLGQTVIAAAVDAPPNICLSLRSLGEAINRRSAIRPEGVTKKQIADALQLLMGQMLDISTFRRQHEVAIGYFMVESD